jgi:Transglycosylase SLT domain/FHA domain
MTHTLPASKTKAWLLSRCGTLAGTRFPLHEGVIRIGRAADNDLVLDGPESATVSLYHAEMARESGSCRLRDLSSTNGTWLNGERITDAEISAPCTIQLGQQGPEFALVFEESGPAAWDRTIETPVATIAQAGVNEASSPAAHESLLAAAVARARRMRAHGVGGQTMTIMRDVIDQALRHTRRRLRIVGWSLLVAILVISSLGIWRIAALNREKQSIDARIRQLEAQLRDSREAAETGRLLSQLNDYQNLGASLQQNLLYRLSGANQNEDFVTRDLRAVMAEFGAEVYSIPPDFIERVNHYIGLDQSRDRPLVARALNQSDTEIQTMRRILQEERLPPDLAYIPIVESALDPTPSSSAGAAGPWQFTAVTARALGLRVDAQVDERKNLVLSTRASCKYLRDLILDFGAGSSVMLALAAYNGGAGKVKQAVMKTVKDPIQQRNFWHLYRAGALPDETREYVPKVFAIMLIGRNPRRFGF